MTTTLEPPAVDAPDAGVIEEARARQRRQRGAVAAAVVAAVVALGLLGFGGGGGGSHSLSSVARHPGHPLAGNAARASPASCGGKALTGAPSKALLSILHVLRRPATAADQVDTGLGGGFLRGVFVHYVRRTRVFNGSSYYIYPAIVGECGTHEKPHQGVMDIATHVDLGHGLIGGVGGGGITAAQIEHGESLSTLGLSSTRALVTMLVPDGVASVTLHFPAGRASGYSPKISPPATITTPAINDEVIVAIPRSSPGAGDTMSWRAADGHTIRTFDRL
jgi:hypothetical protein